MGAYLETIQNYYHCPCCWIILYLGKNMSTYQWVPEWIKWIKRHSRGSTVWTIKLAEHCLGITLSVQKERESGEIETEREREKERKREREKERACVCARGNKPFTKLMLIRYFGISINAISQKMPERADKIIQKHFLKILMDLPGDNAWRDHHRYRRTTLSIMPLRWIFAIQCTWLRWSNWDRTADLTSPCVCSATKMPNTKHPY